MNASIFTNVHTTLINKCIGNYLSLENKALKIFIKDLTTLKENQITYQIVDSMTSEINIQIALAMVIAAN